jgi:hypothetical protein
VIARHFNFNRSHAYTFCLKRTDAHHLVPTSLKFVWHRFKRNFPRVAEIVDDPCDVRRHTSIQGK